jgi:hypothetical protein
MIQRAKWDKVFLSEAISVAREDDEPKLELRKSHENRKNIIDGQTDGLAEE